MTEQQEKIRRILAAVDRELAREAPLVVGPWTGEVGYELLYWIPFVRWVLTTFHVDPARVIVVSRGGTASWYSGMGFARYVDAFDLMTAAELVALGEGAKPKQSRTSGDPAGDELLRRVTNACGLNEAARLLPHWMYRLYRYYWDGDASLDFVEQHARWLRVEAPTAEDVVTRLPAKYVAVRFYFSRSFPDNENNRRFANAMLTRLADHVPVVLLTHPFTLDDHSDYRPSLANVSSVADEMTPANNLTVQSAVIGRAAAFVGTYGGLSLLPPLCGVLSCAFCSVPFMKPLHEQAIQRMIQRARGAPLRVASAQDSDREADAVLELMTRQTHEPGLVRDRAD